MGQTYFQSFKAAGDLAGRTIAKYTANAREVVVAAAATDPLAGVVDLDASTGQLVDLAIGDMFEVRVGAAVAAGDPLTSDAKGRAIKAVKGAGVVYVIGFAMAAGVENDIVPYKVSPFVIAA